MSTLDTVFDDLDRDGASDEAAAGVGLSRLDVFRRAAIGGGALVAAGAVLSPATALAHGGGVPASDIKILNYALTLEYLEAAFYAQGLRHAGLHGREYEFARVVAHHEAAHVAFLRQALGRKAVKSPKFDFGKAVTDRATFLATSEALEDTGVSAYAGQGPRIKNRAVVAAALSIHSVEARHASWIRDIRAQGGNGLPAPVSFDKPRTMAQVLAIVKKTGFIVG